MIQKSELLRIYKDLGLPLSTIEKDYVLGLVIFGISRHHILGSSWIFKGGTALKKCYFGDYRFSEDLDYTLIEDTSTDPGVIQQYLAEVFEMLYDTFGLKISSQ